jgi:hypothetical protein
MGILYVCFFVAGDYSIGTPAMYQTFINSSSTTQYFLAEVSQSARFYQELWHMAHLRNA